jgi:hypothetical protein
MSRQNVRVVGTKSGLNLAAKFIVRHKKKQDRSGLSRQNALQSIYPPFILCTQLVEGGEGGSLVWYTLVQKLRHECIHYPH